MKPKMILNPQTIEIQATTDNDSLIESYAMRITPGGGVQKANPKNETLVGMGRN